MHYFPEWKWNSHCLPPRIRMISSPILFNRTFFGPRLSTVTRPLLSHQVEGCAFAGSIVGCNPSFSAALRISETLGVLTEDSFLVSLPCWRVWLRSRYTGHMKIRLVFCICSFCIDHTLACHQLFNFLIHTE